LHHIAEIHQHLGDAAHADAADPDEMNRADVTRQFHAVALYRPELLPPGRASVNDDQRLDYESILATSITSSASRSAASSLPMLRAAAAMAARRPGADASASISPASRSGVKPFCTMRMAPPAFSSTAALANWS